MLSHADSSHLKYNLRDQLESYCHGSQVKVFEFAHYSGIWIPLGNECCIEVGVNSWKFDGALNNLVITKRSSLSVTNLIDSKKQWIKISVQELLNLQEQRQLLDDWQKLGYDYELNLIFSDYLGQESMITIHKKTLSVLKTIGIVDDVSPLSIEQAPQKSGFYPKSTKHDFNFGTYQFEILAPIRGSSSSSMYLQVKTSNLVATKSLDETIEMASIKMQYVGSYAGDSESHESTKEIRSRLQGLHKMANMDEGTVGEPGDIANINEKIRLLLIHLKEVGYERIRVGSTNDENFDEQLPLQTNLDFLDIFFDIISPMDLSGATYALKLVLEKIVAGELVPRVKINLTDSKR